MLVFGEVVVAVVVAAAAAAIKYFKRFIYFCKVNGVDVTSATHQEAVIALVSPTHKEIHLLVRHDPPPPGLQVWPTQNC